jgi:carbonic anhydrase/acetyltransferase-like protein (isoleucine patch superfamily)
MISPDARVLPFRGALPLFGAEVFLAPGAMVLGDVILEDRCSIWYHTVIRGDVNFIRVGKETNIQDHVVIHVTPDNFPARIGSGVSIGHRAVVHGATVEDGALIGIGAVVMDGAVIGGQSIVAAGSLVSPGMIIPPRSLAIGSPARVKRSLRPDELDLLRLTTEHYVEYARLHATELGLPLPAPRSH